MATLRSIMKRDPITVGDTDVLGNAHQIMTRAQIRHLPVTSDGRVIGVLSERDVLAARARSTDLPWWKLQVHDAMTMPPHTAHPDDSIIEAAARLAMYKLGCLPVIELGRLVGIVTVTDVLDAEVRAAMAATPEPPSTQTGYHR